MAGESVDELRLILNVEETVSISASFLQKMISVCGHAGAVVDAYESEDLDLEAMVQILKKDLIWMGMRFDPPGDRSDGSVV